MRNYGILILFSIGLFSCTEVKKMQPSVGIWKAELTVQDNQALPFNFELEKSNGKYTIELYNADEIIKVDEIDISNDSIIIRTPVFEGYIAAKFTEKTIKGEFINESLNRIVPFKATFGNQERFKVMENPKVNVSGVWETEFNPNATDSYMAKGIFNQKGHIVTGTFRTTTGDYRFLEGVVDGDSLKLSVFDGAHAFLFMAKVTDSTLNGTFYSGNHSKDPFKGKRNEGFELPSEDSLTFLKQGYRKVAFSFPDINGNLVSLEDKIFKDKVVIIQIMGTWCPNCLDESKFLVNYLKHKPNTDVKVVALAFEYAKTKEIAFKRINRLKNAIGIDYPVLLAQFATTNKTKAQEKLPMLNHVLSYPTTIFIDKKGMVRRIHTGFNGPATGDKYNIFKKEFDEFINKLSDE